MRKDKKLFLIISIVMGVVVISSNYLVQFPVNFFNLESILTYGAFSYPVAFLITDLANRAYGKIVARKIVLIGFFLGISLTLFVSTNFDDIISVRIAIGSGLAFFIAQNIDVNIFDFLRKKTWYVAPLSSSLTGSVIDTFLFFSIAFYGTSVPWITLALGDLLVKFIVAIALLIPFRMLLSRIVDVSNYRYSIN